MSAPRSWLRFSAGGLDVMVNASAFRRALPAPTPLPARVELSGEPYPVIDLAAAAGAAPSASPPSLLLVLSDETTRLAVPATDVWGRFEAGPEEPTPLPWPYDSESGWCAGVLIPAGNGARPVLLLDLAGLVRAAESGALAGGKAAG